MDLVVENLRKLLNCALRIFLFIISGHFYNVPDCISALRGDVAKLNLPEPVSLLRKNDRLLHLSGAFETQLINLSGQKMYSMEVLSHLSYVLMSFYRVIGRLIEFLIEYDFLLTCCLTHNIYKGSFKSEEYTPDTGKSLSSGSVLKQKNHPLIYPFVKEQTEACTFNHCFIINSHIFFVVNIFN